jgi:hypothetical protein
MNCRQKIEIIFFAVIPFFIVFSSSCVSTEYKNNLQLVWEEDFQKYFDKMTITADRYSSSKSTPTEIAEAAQSNSEQEYFIYLQSLRRYYTAIVSIEMRNKALKEADKFAQNTQKQMKQFVIQRVIDNRMEGR